MNKNIADYLPYYIGQELFYFSEDGENNGKMLFDRYRSGYKDFDAEIMTRKGTFSVTEFIASRWKLALRPLSDMTEEEKAEMMNQKHKYDTGNKFSHQITDAAYRIEWAIKKGFDVFGLIEAGLAVDKTKEVRNATN